MPCFHRFLTFIALVAHTFVSSAGAVAPAGAWDAYAAVNVGTAGISHTIATEVLELPADQMSMGQHVALTLQEKALWAAVRHSVGTVLETGIQGQKFGETLRHRALTGVAEVGGAEFAKMLGQTYRLGEGEINYVTHKLGHALVGGGMGALLSTDDRGRGALTGALSGMLSEVVAEKILNPQDLGMQLVQGEMTPSGLQTHLHDAVRNIRLGLSTLALLAHGDPHIADTVSQNALENNAIPAVLVALGHPAVQAALISATVSMGTALYLLPKAIDDTSRMYGMDEAHPELTGPQILDTPIAENAPFQESFTVEDLQNLILSTPNASEVLQQLQHLPGFDIIPQFLQGIQIFTSDGESFTPGTKALLPGEGRVGTYGELRNKVSKPRDNLSAHHMPHDHYMQSKGIKRNEGISMMVQDPVPGRGGRHREIHKTLPKQQLDISPRSALSQSVKRVREVYSKDGVYTPEIRSSLQDVIQSNKGEFPKLFKKK